MPDFLGGLRNRLAGLSNPAPTPMVGAITPPLGAAPVTVNPGFLTGIQNSFRRAMAPPEIAPVPGPEMSLPMPNIPNPGGFTGYGGRGGIIPPPITPSVNRAVAPSPVTPDSTVRPNFRAGRMSTNVRPGQTPRARRAGGSGMRMY